MFLFLPKRRSFILAYLCFHFWFVFFCLLFKCVTHPFISLFLFVRTTFKLRYPTLFLRKIRKDFPEVTHSCHFLQLFSNSGKTVLVSHSSAQISGCSLFYQSWTFFLNSFSTDSTTKHLCLCLISQAITDFLSCI